MQEWGSFIWQDIVRLISQYLHDEGYHQACQTLQSEAELKQIEWKEEKADIQQLKKSISSTLLPSLKLKL